MWDERRYGEYNACCNAHRFDALDAFVAPDVRVNDEAQGLDAYVAGLEAVVRAFPDYRWTLRRLLIDAPWISAQFRDTGTHRGPFLGVPATGRAVDTVELALYRIEADRIAEVWVAADNLRVLEQLGRPA
jgi:predicted ester cyclase